MSHKRCAPVPHVVVAMTAAAAVALAAVSLVAAAASLKGKLPGAIVADKDYALAGKMSVRAWPTTVVIQWDGQQAAQAYRAAFESTSSGRMLKSAEPVPPPPKS